MMRRPSLTASIGPSPVLGFMAAMSNPLSDGYLTIIPYFASEQKTRASTTADYGGVQSYPSDQYAM
jgi:hypothetical protein